MRHIALAIAIVSLLCLSSMITVSTSVCAGVRYYSTEHPSSFNSSYWTVYPRYSSTPVTSYGAQVYADANEQSIYTSSTGLVKYVETNDFTNPTWIDASTEDQVVGWMPGVNATITNVYVYLIFTSGRPQTQLMLSVNDKGTWASSATYSAAGAGYGQLIWNVTGLASWTSALLNGTDVWVKAKMYPAAGIYYYLDYLGFVIAWNQDFAEEEEQIPPTEDLDQEDAISNDTGGARFDYDIIYSAEGIIGILGGIGLIGMIAVPALGVFVYRANQGEGKMNIFVKMLVLFMFCLTLFMVSINGA